MVLPNLSGAAYPSVKGGYPSLEEEKSNLNAQGSHGLGASPVRLESQGGDFSADRAGADASHLLRRKIRKLILDRSIQAGASGAYWPCPQTNDLSFPHESFTYRRPSLNGYGAASI